MFRQKVLYVLLAFSFTFITKDCAVTGVLADDQEETRMVDEEPSSEAVLKETGKDSKPETVLPEGEIISADNEDVPPVGSVSADKKEVPEAGFVSTGEGTVPEGEAVPTGEETAPEGEAVPTEEETAPEDEAVPTEEENAPEDGAVPTEEETAPEGEAVPTGEENILKIESVSTDEKILPEGEAVSTDAETVQEEDFAASGEERIPAAGAEQTDNAGSETEGPSSELPDEEKPEEAPAEYDFSRVEISDEVLSYTGSERTKKSVAVYGNVTVNGVTTETELLEGTDYLIDYTDNIQPGTALITIRGIGNYEGKTRTETFEIIKANVDSIKMREKAFVYTGSPVEPEIRVYALSDQAKVLLSPGSDYDVRYTDNIDAGSAEVTVTGKGNFQGTVSRSFSITPAAITSVSIKYPALQYNGKARKQTASTVVKCGKKILTNKIDYTISYTNNRNVGTAVMTVKGKGNYKGTIKKSFAIKGRLADASLKHDSLDYNGKKRTQNGSVTVTGDRNGERVTLNRGTDYKITYANNKDVGTATMTISGKGDYTGTITKTFEIKAVSIMDAVLPCVKRLYTGKTIQPEPVVTARVGGEIVTLTRGIDYTVTYKKNKEPGTAFVTVTGIGNFKGKLIRAFEITRTKTVGKGTTRTVYFGFPDKKYKNLRAAVWSNRNGQDDLKWCSPKKKSDGIWALEVDFVNFCGSGTASVHLFNGNKFLCDTTFTIVHKDWLQAQSERFKAEFLHGTNKYANIDYIQCAINIAKNDYYGYGHTWRANRHTLSCAGLVGLCLTHCGYGDLIKDDPIESADNTRWGYIDLGTYSRKYDWTELLVKELGATWHIGLEGLEPGDILYYDRGVCENHTGFYLGNGMTVEARAPLRQPSYNDDTGSEIGIFSDAFQAYRWQGYFRMPKKNRAW